MCVLSRACAEGLKTCAKQVSAERVPTERGTERVLSLGCGGASTDTDEGRCATRVTPHHT